MLAVAVAVTVRDVDAAGPRPPRCPLTRRCRWDHDLFVPV